MKLTINQILSLIWTDMLVDLAKKTFLSPFVLMVKLAFWGLLLVVIGGIVFLLAFDLNRFRGDIEEAATKFLQQEMKINGDVSFGVEGWRPSLALRDVRIGRDGRTTIVLAEKLEVTIPFSRPEEGNPWSFFANLENIKVDGRRVGDYEIPVRFARDGFDIPDISGRLDDSRLEGSISYLGGKFLADIRVLELDYAHLADGVTGGNGRTDIRLEGTGKSFPVLLRSLNGHIRFVAGEGALSSNAVNFWAGDLLTSVVSGGRKGRLNCAIADFTVTNGIAVSKTVVFDTEDVTVFGRGKIDLVRQRMDMIFTPKPKNPTLISLATPVVVEGDFDALRVVPDRKAVAEKIGGFLLGAIAPPAALLSLTKLGTGVQNPCLAFLSKGDTK